MNTLMFKKSFHVVLMVTSFCVSAKKETSSFKLGVENVSASLLQQLCPDKKKESCIVGLITNQTGVDQKGKRTVEVLADCGIIVKYIFAPEHGLNGTLAERDVHDSIDKKTKIPVLSLYGNGSGKMISAEYMNELDCLLFDIQDSGMRHYTYISTLLNTMKIAAEYNKPYVVLDRPNPLGSLMQGPLVQPDLISFISIASIPLRHGMTIAELAQYFNKNVLDKPVSLSVVPMVGYDRNIGFMGTFIHQLSPNLQSLQSCYGYSFLGLLGEVESFEVGVGTHMAFRCIALPVDKKVSQDVWRRLQTLFNSFGVKSFLYHHTNPKNNRKSKGLRLEFSDVSQLRSFELFIAILEFFKKEEIPFSFSASFNKAVGNVDVQKLCVGTIKKEEFFNNITQDLKGFADKAQSCFLYQPAPIYLNSIDLKKATSANN